MLPGSPSRSRTAAALFLWPIAAFTAAHQVRDTLVTTPGGDFIPVWQAARAFVNGGAPYSVNGFLYPPSAVLLFAPVGTLTVEQAHVVMHALNTACLLASVFLALRIFRIQPSSPVAAAVIYALFISLPGRLTLYLDNVNGVVLATETIALVAALAGRPIVAGTIFGLGLAAKPVLLPLIVLPALARQWRTIAAAAIVPVVLTLLVVRWLPGGLSFVTEVVPFLWKGAYASNYAINTSLAGAVTILQWPQWIATVLRVAALSAGVALVAARCRGGGDERAKAAELIAIVLSVSFLVFSFSWNFYGLFLLPLFVAFAGLASTYALWRLALGGVALYMIGSQDYLARLGAVRITCGYLVLLAALMPTGRLWDARSAAPDHQM